VITGALIGIGLISSVSSMTWIGPRVAMAMGEDFRALRLLGWKSPTGIPYVAMLVQFAIVNLLLLTSSFKEVLVYIQLTLILSSFATVLGVIVLRFTQPDLPRPFRAWGYPVTPLVFLGVSLFMMVYLVQSNPMEALYGGITLAVGLCVYLLCRKGGAALEGNAAVVSSVATPLPKETTFPSSANPPDTDTIDPAKASDSEL
jgi:APA family basic amino acid/polyamine antiporter